MLPGFRIPAIEEAARGAVAAGHSGDHDTVRHQRRDDSDIAFLVVGKFLLPDLLAGLHVEGDDVAIERLAKQLAVIDSGPAAHDGASISDPRRSTLVLHRRAPARPRRCSDWWSRSAPAA